MTPSPTPDLGPPPAGLADIERVFSNVIAVAVGLGSVAMLTLFVWAGFKFLTAGGEPKALQSAHQTFTWAILGIAFMVVAWIVLLLIKAFTGVDVTLFNPKVLF